MDMDWPHNNRDLGARISYGCPYRTMTEPENSIGKIFSFRLNIF